MKAKRMFRCLVLHGLIVLGLGACKDGEAPGVKASDRGQIQGEYPKFSYLRGLSERDLAPDRFLGNKAYQ